MASLDDLGFGSITDKTTEQNIENLRQIRLNRRTPVRTTKTTTTKKPKAAKTSDLSREQAAELLKLLTGEE